MLTTLVQNINSFYYLSMCLKTTGCVDSRVDPDQTPQNALYDLGLHWLLRLMGPNT